MIPAKRNVFVTAFLGIWLVGWAFGWVSAFSQMISGQGGAAADGFMLVWITAWTLGGFAAGVALAWSIAGREHILLAPGTFTISQRVFNIGRTKEYDLSHVSRLRVSPDTYNPFDVGSRMRYRGLGGGKLAFDYGASTVRFGGGVDEGEAHILRDELLRRSSSFGDSPALRDGGD